MSDERIEKLEKNFIEVISSQNKVIKNIVDTIDSLSKRVKLQQDMLLSLHEQLELIAKATVLKPKIYKKSDESN